MPFFFDTTGYILIVLPCVILAFIAQMNVKSTFDKYSKVASRKGMTAAEVARSILDNDGLNNVSIEHIEGNLTDHYDPRTKVVRLSTSVYSSTSVAAIGIAAHEVGHAIQHSKGYVPVKIRSAIIPATQFASNLAMPLVIAGFIFSSRLLWLAYLGIVFFAVATFFQLVTLPVEFNASARAIKILGERDILEADELSGTKKVLGAAAMTYLAALAVSLANLLRIILMFNRRN